jgi:hypothetical protein
MRRVVNDAMVSVGALAALLTLVVAVDGRAREQVKELDRVRDVVGVIVDVATDAMRLHTTLTVFVVVATVLTVFMVRT